MTDRVAETVLGPEAEGVRLDLYLAGRFSYCSRNEWQKNIEKGWLVLNGRKTRPSRKLHEGEKLTFTPRDVEEPPVCAEYRILEENPAWLAVEKSGNLPCHPAGAFFKNTLWYLLRERYGNVHIATRLDRETSGIVLAARNAAAAAKFTKALTLSRVVKKYYAIVFGAFPDQPVQADGWLSHDPDSAVNKKRRFTADPVPESERASTFLRKADFQNGLSLVEAIPSTGRLHQIRATLCSLGFPMVGDKLYGPDERIFIRFVERKTTDSDRDMLLMSRQALHAHFLELDYEGRRLSFSSPLPDDMFIRDWNRISRNND